MLIRLLADQRLFLWLVIALLALSAVRFAFAGNWNQAGYSACAALLNVFVTMGAK